jgi:hypothetical protein
VVYVLRDADTDELLKVGQTTVASLDNRFPSYVAAAKRTGRNVVLDTMTFSEKATGVEVGKLEGELRKRLNAKGHPLPWDNTGGRLGRPGPGVPGLPLPPDLLPGHEWDYDLETIIPKRRAKKQ